MGEGASTDPNNAELNDLSTASCSPTEDDFAVVTELLGREPQGSFEVLVRRLSGSPVVLGNGPLLDDGRPMPTRFWLADKALVKAIGRLESVGGVKAAQVGVDPAELEAAHQAYKDEREAQIPSDYQGPRPYGGVGGTRKGVKCLHAHYANFIVGGTDPVGRWVHKELQLTGHHYQPIDSGQSGDVGARVGAGEESTLVIEVGTESTDFVLGLGSESEQKWVASVGADSLVKDYYLSDPPDPAELAAALSIVELHVDDANRELAELASAVASGQVIGSGLVATIAAVEIGLADEDWSKLEGFVLTQEAAEDVFRTVACEARADRLHNPGLPGDQIDTVLGAATILVEVMRQLGLTEMKVARFTDTDRSAL